MKFGVRAAPCCPGDCEAVAAAGHIDFVAGGAPACRVRLSSER